MNRTLKLLLTNGRIITLVVFLVFALFAIHPKFGVEGVAIRAVAPNSTAAIAGIESPSPASSPTSREVLFAINNNPITNVRDYETFIKSLEVNETFTLETDRGFYRLSAEPLIQINELDERINKTITETILENITTTNNETNETTTEEVSRNVTTIVEVFKTEEIVIGVKPIGLSVYEAPKSNLRKGLDIQGGTRVLLEPEEKLTDEDMETLLDNMKQRLNVFGLTDVIIREANDLSGNQYVLVEIAGANEEEVKELLSKQGKFEAKIGNESVFRGGSDITYVCRSADCSGLDPNFGCSGSAGSFSCRFVFSISLLPAAAKRQADLTRDLEVITENNNRFLSEPLRLFLDDVEVDQLQISDDLRGRAVTEISISGSGVGPSEQEAIFDTLANMKSLQTILITGSLPVKLEIVQTNNLSPVLGKEFLNNAIWVGFWAILSVAFVILLRYRSLKIAIPVLINMVSEITLLLGFAGLVGWNLDLVAIAGILVAVGTGVDDQIIIADETISGEKEQSANWKKRLKNAFFIIFAAYATTMFAMAPLVTAGAGLLKGFAFTTMTGITFGVFITRPAFAAMLKILLKE